MIGLQVALGGVNLGQPGRYIDDDFRFQLFNPTVLNELPIGNLFAGLVNFTVAWLDHDQYSLYA